MRSNKPFSAGKPTFVIFITLLLASAIVSTQAQAQKFKVLHTFHGAPNDGTFPLGAVITDSQGNLYGTTDAGGSGSGQCGTSGGCGTAFKMNKAGKLIWLHSFKDAIGWSPLAGLLRDKAGDLFGTTAFGGKYTNVCGGAQGGGCGIVFKLDKNGKETVLHRFNGGTDGDTPEALLVGDPSGILYGTTYIGPGGGTGTVFELNKAGKETVLHHFDLGGGDGEYPYPGVIRDDAGNLYGVTAGGGSSGYGTVYEVDSVGNEKLLYSFGGSDGSGPASVLVADKAGNLYGTTEGGGSSSGCGNRGCGVVFELSPQTGGNWTETVLYSFCSQSNCSDGERPLDGPLVRDAGGNLYGTTHFGGAYDEGIVFELDTSGRETVLHNFTGGADGGAPWAGLTVDRAGKLYGSAAIGGDLNCEPTYGGCGVVFKIAP